MLPEEKARVKIDKQLRNAGWDIVSRNEYLPNSTTAVKEALMVGNTESDYLLFIEGKAIAVVEAKREENPLGDEVKKQFLLSLGMRCGLKTLFHWYIWQMEIKYISRTCLCRIVSMKNYPRCILPKRCFR